MIENFEHPWFLLLFLLVLPLLIWRRPKYFLRHSYLKAIIGAKKIAPTSFLKWIGWVLIVMAAVDYRVGYKESFKKLITHKYVLVNDGSGSMVGDDEKNGVGKKLTTLLKANDLFLKTLENLKRSDSSKDSVSMIVFSDDPFVVSYFVEDYDFIRHKMFQIDWRVRPPLNSGTEMNKAIWASVNLILKKNKESGGSFLSDEEFANLGARLKGSTGAFSLENSYSSSSKMPIIKEQISGSSIIAFTDGIFPITGDRNVMSVFKLLSLCRQMGIRFYLISVELIDVELLNYIKLTGGNGIIVSGFNQEKINNSYQEIINQQAGEYKIIDRHQKRSYAEWFAGTGFALLLIYIVIRNTISRSLTEI